MNDGEAFGREPRFTFNASSREEDVDADRVAVRRELIEEGGVLPFRSHESAASVLWVITAMIRPSESRMARKCASPLSSPRSDVSRTAASGARTRCS